MRLAHLFHRGFAKFIYRDGTAFVPSMAAKEWPERVFLKRLLSRLEVDCVLDVGASLGQYASELRTIGFKGHVISFEPDPKLYSQIARWSKNHKMWHTMNVALGDTVGEATFNLMKVSSLNSFHEPSFEETALFNDVNTVVNRIQVKVDTLNNLLPKLKAEYGFNRPFLKMDTQGHDVDVFNGGCEIYDQLVGLQSELSVKRIYKNTLRWTDAIAAYEARGFRLAGLYSVNPHDDFLCELDCFMERDDAK